MLNLKHLNTFHFQLQIKLIKSFNTSSIQYNISKSWVTRPVYAPFFKAPPMTPPTQHVSCALLLMWLLPLWEMDHSSLCPPSQESFCCRPPYARLKSQRSPALPAQAINTSAWREGGMRSPEQGGLGVYFLLVAQDEASVAWMGLGSVDGPEV